MSYESDREAISALVGLIQDAGLRPFVAKSGTYGFYTDAWESGVVTFSSRYGGQLSFAGTYVTSDPRATGTGWELEPAGFVEMLDETPPNWALKGATGRQKSLAEYLDDYQSSSVFTEVRA